MNADWICHLFVTDRFLNEEKSTFSFSFCLKCHSDIISLDKDEEEEEEEEKSLIRIIQNLTRLPA